MSAESNPRAFPTSAATDGKFRGMTLRDYFAAAALQGMLADGLHTRGATPDDIALVCGMMADAMMRDRPE